MPQLLLKRFAADDPPTAVHVFDKNTGKRACWKIADTAVEGRRYPDSVEAILSQHEGAVAPILARWAAAPDEPLPDHDRQNVALFLAFLYLRTPSASGFVQEHSRQLVPALARLMRTDPSLLRMIREQVLAADPSASIASADDLERALKPATETPGIEIVPHKATLLAMMLVEPVLRALLRMHWTVLVSPPERPFWLSDAAAMVLAFDRGQIRVGGGIGLPGADVLVPLSSTFALHASYRSSPRTRDVLHEEHLGLRRWTVFYADRFVFSPLAFEDADPILAAASQAPPRRKVDEVAARAQWSRLLRPLLIDRSRGRDRG